MEPSLVWIVIVKQPSQDPRLQLLLDLPQPNFVLLSNACGPVQVGGQVLANTHPVHCEVDRGHGEGVDNLVVVLGGSVFFIGWIEMLSFLPGLGPYSTVDIDAGLLNLLNCTEHCNWRIFLSILPC